MVGLFSRFTTSRTGHRRTQSALDQREIMAPSMEATTDPSLATAASTGPHGIEVAVEFKPIEHPAEPLDNDQPIQCPLPEPSILNDGRIWKERVSSGVQRTSSPVIQEQDPVEAPNPIIKSRSSSKLGILPSVSAPEHNFLKYLEESGMN